MVVVAYGIIYAIVFLFGICIGSFLNVVIYRVPLGINVAKGRSFCPHCNNQLEARDLVPLVSFCLLGGRCRFCKEKISFRYPIVEALVGLAAITSVTVYWLTWHGLIVFAVECVLIAIAFIDWDTQEIPDTLNIIILLLGVVCIFVVNDVTFLERVIGFFAVSIPMIIINFIVKDSFGGGDIKLVAASGFFMGWQGILVGSFLAILLGGIYGIILLCIRKKHKKDHFAFGPFLAIGLTLGIFAGKYLWVSYLSLFGF